MKNLIFLLIVAACSFHKSPNSLPELLLIHGSHFDGTSWQLTKAKLSQKFHVINPSNPNRNSTEVLNLNQVASEFCKTVKLRATIVGHSYGGAIANQMVAICPKKIRAIIYVTAVVPRTGEGSFDLLSQRDQDNYSETVEFSEKTINPKKPEIFFSIMMNRADIIPQISIFPEPSSLGSDKLQVKIENLASVPKAYIITTKDKIISPQSQELFIKREGITLTTKIESGHLPMLTHPEDLVNDIIHLNDGLK